MVIYFIILIILKITLSEPFCEKGKKNCDLCNPMTNLCLKCEYDIYSLDNYGGCENQRKCIFGKNHCLECTNEGNLCEKCDEGYFPDENGGCSFSTNCEVSYKGACLKCKENYILNEKIKICESINSQNFKNCEIFSFDGTCEECKDDFYLTSEDKQCTKTQNCKESIFNTCTKCDIGYYLDKKEEKCILQSGDLLHCKEVLDGKNCNICDDDFYFSEDKKCVNTNYCKKVGELGICESCSSGYFISEFDKSCTTTENCYIGIKNIGLCEQCNSGYYIDFKDGKCKSNSEENEFKYCRTAKEICNECIPGYYLGNDHKCTDNKYCSESLNGECTECKNNYYLGLDNRCSEVENCIYSNEYECEECKNNFYYERYRRKCIEWEGRFINCKYGYEIKGCERCKDDYYLNQTDNLCYSNNINNKFYKCAMTDANGLNCIFCIQNYFLSNMCTKVKGCDYAEEEDRCLECNSHYCLDLKTGLCEHNDINNWKNKTFYFQCKKTNINGTECEECLEGLFLHENGTCIYNLTNTTNY